MLYVLLTVAALVVALLLLHLRIRGEYDGDRRWLFLGLGRSGVHVDFTRSTVTLKVFGISVKTVSGRSEPRRQRTTEPEPRKPVRRRSVSPSELLKLFLQSRTALWRCTVGMLRSVVVEQLQAEVRGGFGAPDLTGRVYGYYAAAAGAAPGLFSHIRYYPDFTGAPFSASARGSISLPLYRFLWHSLNLFVRLPLRDIYRLAIGRKKGEQDV